MDRNYLSKKTCSARVVLHKGNLIKMAGIKCCSFFLQVKSRSYFEKGFLKTFTLVEKDKLSDHKN